MINKKIIFILICITNLSYMSGQSSYQNEWKKVEDFDKKGLPKSALEVVNDIRTKASKEKNDNQLIKVYLHEAKYMLTLEEDAQLKIITNFKKEIAASEFPKKNILQSILANLYWQYFNQNRWKFYNRSQAVSKIDEVDFRTWDLNTLFKEIHTYFQNSLENGVLAQQTNLSKFDAILTTQKDSKNYRPTLYDFLNHNALEFYKTSETNITKPAYSFTIDNASYLQETEKYNKLVIETKDTLSLQFNALKIYQNLLKFHSKTNNTKALTEANLERLLFVYEHIVIDTKDTLLEQSLITEKNKIAIDKSSALYAFEIANLYHKQAGSYVFEKEETHRWKNKKALELCESTIKQFPMSRGGRKCTNLSNEIKRNELTLNIEKFIPIQTYGKLLVRYKNLNKLYFNAFPINHKSLEELRRLYKVEDQIQFFSKLKSTNTWEAEIKNEGDYQSHTTEVMVPKLEGGTFLIVASTSKKAVPDNIFAYGDTQITNLAMITSRKDNNLVFQVLDRNDGAPIVDAKLHLKTNSSRHHGTKIDKILNTDHTGQAFFTNNNGQHNVSISVSKHKDEVLFTNQYLNKSISHTSVSKAHHQSFLFTDRSIYRPGQVVYFKGIVMTATDNKNHKVLPNYDTHATLKDANGQEVKKVQLKTNSYGSFNGEFILPTTGLTGNFTISTLNHNSIHFSVEEYKRPKFEAAFTPIEKTYKINDNITVKGTALAYAGSKISDAKVSYKVSRKAAYPRWCYWYPRTTISPQEITHGETKTDKNGEFSIDFKAIPDLKASKENSPIFNYEITADVTDINGETRSTTTVVKVGYHSMQATLTIDEELNKTKKDNFLSLVTTNLNDVAIVARGTVSIYKLEAPKKPIRKRPWKAPDYPGFQKEAFTKLYPNEAFKNENDYRFWKKGKKVFLTPFTTTASNSIDESRLKIKLPKSENWPSGKYVIELETKDAFGKLVKDIQYTTLYSDSDSPEIDQQLLKVTTNKKSYAIGDEAIITFNSASKAISITVDIEKNNTIIKTEILKLSKSSKTIKIPVTKEDIGGFAVSYSFINYNDHKSDAIIIPVPYPSTELQIETKTFRDKLSPGQEETWSFTIKGPKGDKVNAELLASMYDSSLDQFKEHKWSFNPIHNPTYYFHNKREGSHSFGVNSFRLHTPTQNTHLTNSISFDRINLFGLYFGRRHYGMVKKASKRKRNNMRMASAPAVMMDAEMSMGHAKESEALDEVVEVVANEENVEITEETSKDKKQTDFKNVDIRTNLNETAFFFPTLSTDEKGNVSFNFTTPEALTKWKVQLLAHTKELQATTMQLETVTQKELMVLPNPPRFLRESDTIHLSSKIANLSKKQLSGDVILQLFDAITNKPIDNNLLNTNANQSFTIDANGNTNVSWKLFIPENTSTVQYKIIAKAGTFSDGEQNVLPVLSNRMLVTETLPMWVRSDQSKTFSLDKLKNNTSTTLKHHKLTLEVTSNPAWYAIQALPYLMEYPYDCAEQTFSKYYANSLAAHIANSNPRIQDVFNQWKSSDALLSNLEKNQELKALLLQETPWVRDAQSETEQKKRIALLFDLNKMKNERASSIDKLINFQKNSGAFPWFNGGRENRSITQYITTGFGHLKKLGITSFESKTQKMLDKSIAYLDHEFLKEYTELKAYCKRHKVDINSNHLSNSQIHYLYMRSFFSDIKRPNKTNEAWTYYLEQSKKYWLEKTLHTQGLLALILHRNEDTPAAYSILKSLNEKSITSDELGMYWKSNTPNWHWYKAPIETQSLLIEAFSEIEKEPKRTTIVDNLKIWLLKNKQTNRWETTKATSNAVYALLLQGSDWLSVNDMVTITVGDQEINPSNIKEVKVEAGTGYFKTSWSGNAIQPKMGVAKISKKGEGIAWGGLYWQYFEDLDKITSAETPLSLKKKIFLKKNTDEGEKITEITSSTKLAIGDLVRVRIELRSDRAMEFVHMKDMRAAGLEPVNVLSQYKWQDNLGYYESTKDAATNFFFDYLPKGVFVFEYDLRVNNKGDFSNGITTIQSMYAPEFSSHSEGIKIRVK